MTNYVASTALGPMVIVAVEQNFPQAEQLIRDEIAYQFLPLSLKALVKLTYVSPLRMLLTQCIEQRTPGVWGGVACRKCYIDDILLASIHRGISTVVNLGAGLDTRVYRFPELAPVSVFEVDLPENIAYKRRMVERIYGAIPAHVTLVPIDFDRQDVEAVLLAHGYQPQQQTFFIWEAVTQYLTEAGVRQIFCFLAKARSGSRLAFTYVRKDFIEGVERYRLDSLYETFRVKEQVWRFGLMPEEVGAFLAEYGWREEAQMGSQEFTVQYVQPTRRAVPVMEIERAVYAERM